MSFLEASAMEFRTKVKIPVQGTLIVPDDKICLLGSCFAEHIGNRMKCSGLDVAVNPFGVLYNPWSIAAMCMAMADRHPFPEDCFFESGGLWHCWLNDSSFSAVSRDACRARLEQTRSEQADRLKDLDYLFLTLGTNRYYELSSGSHIVVGNCHKQPARLFTECNPDVEQTVAVLEQALSALWSVRPSLRVVFTVSPYRYAKYGFHESRLGKSVLLLAVDSLCRRHEQLCTYFPAYEILLDELRDYRFYADDMLHPSAAAVSYIWECFSGAYLAAETRDFVAEWEAIDRALAHRPLHPESPAYRKFLQQTILKIEQLNKKYKKAAFSTECERLKRLLINT